MSLISSLLFLIDFGGYESFVKFYFIKLRMRNFYLPKTISSSLGLALKTPKTITLGDICKSTRTSRKKSFMLRSTTTKVNDRLHIKSHTWAVSKCWYFCVYVNKSTARTTQIKFKYYLTDQV